MPDGQVSVATTANERGAAMAAAAAAAGADRIFLMGYDYHWDGSDPGASSPLDRLDGDPRDLTWSLDLYAALGVPVERTLLGLPLYGLTWPVVGPGVGSPATGRGNDWVPRRNLRVLEDPDFAPDLRADRERGVLRGARGTDRRRAARGLGLDDGRPGRVTRGRLERRLLRFAAQPDPQARPRRRARPRRCRLLGDRLRAGPAEPTTTSSPRSARASSRPRRPMPTTTEPPVLSRMALNRATLARQLLLEPVALDPVAAVERLGGLQAQEPASPYLALWTRLSSFVAVDLDDAITERAVVKATLMRATLHLVSAHAYSGLQPAVAPMHQAIRRPDRADPPDEAELERSARAAAAFATQPRSLGELRDHLAGGPDAVGRDPGETLWWLRRRVPLIHAPEAGQPWSFGRHPRLVAAMAWLPGLGAVDDALALEALVRRYLGAFGPAMLADIGAWSGLRIGRLRPAIDALDGAGALWHGRDHRGRALVDLVAAPRPPADTPAPPRLLPMWDSVLLAHRDRTRIMSDADRAFVIARNGDTLATFLVDGEVGGRWWADPGPGGRTTIAIEPFRPIDGRTRRALEAEGERLAAFVEPREPRVYTRFQRWRVAMRVPRA